MKGLILGCEEALYPGLPGKLQTWAGGDGEGEIWDLVVVMPGVTGELPSLFCRLLLMPGEGSAGLIQADCVVTYGFNSRDSLTWSGLQEPVLCVQRTLPRPDGGEVEPQEIPLRIGQVQRQEWLPLLGTWLLLGEPESFGQKVQILADILTNTTKGL